MQQQIEQINLPELIENTLQIGVYHFDDYEIILRRAIVQLVGNPRFDGDVDTDDAAQLMNLYRLLWKLKPYFKS